MAKEIIVSGIQPTGLLHLGNYLGALRNWKRLQDEYRGHCFFFIADYHAMTDAETFKGYGEHTSTLAVELLALGLDPKKTTLFFQRDAPEVTELAWMFNTVTPVSFLERMTQFKDKSERVKSVSMGLFDYPVLQAADILIYGGTHVPVGEDQIQHVELTRDIARFWNNRFGQTFSETKPLLTLTPRVMALNFPEKKMSKSIPGSTINLADTPEEIRAKVKKAVTDTAPMPKGKMSLGVENLFTLLTEFAPPEEAIKFKRQHDDGSIKYSELKDAIADHISAHFADFRTKRSALMKKPDHVKKVFAAGAKKARAVAQATMKDVRKKIGF
jgi:tryptophanyl-tRNA synthetase